MKKQTRRLIIPCVAAAFTIGASMMSFAATGWVQEDGSWRYYDRDGNYVENEWKKSGNYWFWLDEDGYMAADQLVEDDDDHYYVGGDGVMLSNSWVRLDNEDPGEDDADTCWYYFGPNGKAYKAADSGRTTFKTITDASGRAKKYAFNGDGKMLYGWVNDSAERQTGDDAWKNGIYYLGGPDDGVMRSSQWEWLEAEDDEQENDAYEGSYWFYFNSNGKKAADTKKTINGRKYQFTENGNALFDWISTPGEAASPSTMFYSQARDSWLSVGWFYTVPGESTDPEGYDEGEPRWFYAAKDGELVKSEIKKINGYYYAFDEYGKMLEGLYKLSVDDRQINDYEEIESEDDLPEQDEAYGVYYFGGTAKEGAMKTGSAIVELDGEKYNYYFGKTGDDRGRGYNGIYDGCIYFHGQRQDADKDEKLAVVEWNGDEDSGDYLVNTSGKIQKKKKNAKDADDRYYCTDASGRVTRVSTEKCENHVDNEDHDGVKEKD
ncbi:MAG: cell wall-binding protein [Eubacteriales bacterium]|nr:cell wall-binding protein [Eubacteriales bacterium]